MSSLLQKPIAVLGGGATALTFAADLTLAGCEIRLYELPQLALQSLGEVLETRQIELSGLQLNFKGIRRNGIAKVDTVTTNISEALSGAGLIILSVPGYAQEAFFEVMIPHLEDGQVVAVFTDNFGSLLLRAQMHRRGCDAKVVVGGINSIPYGTRKIAPGRVECLVTINRLYCDTLPSKDGEYFFNEIKELPSLDRLATLEKGDTVIGIGFSNPNPLVHVPGSILNVGAMEVSQLEEGVLGIPKGKFSMYKHGMSPAVSRVQYSYYQELRKVADGLGINIPDYPKEDFFWKLSIMGVEYWAPFADVVVPPIVGPLSVEDRYFIEDISIGCVAYYNFAGKLGIQLPIMESLIRLGCVICERDFFKEGRTLEQRG
ncbi:NAD/NADP-dependent octopine/nopaline dehydrogenase family protein, partial [Candidatus Hakubella thermalkaliphila]